MNNKAKALIGVLNWGLGHATRCVPVINDYINKGYEVVLAGDGESLLLLEKEFPQLKSERLPSYNIKYSKGNNLILSLLLSSPRILKNVKKEQNTVARLQEKYDFNIIISDNRPGVYHKEVKSVYITHQTNIKAGVFSYLANKVNSLYLKNFNEIWIPDFEGEKSLAGDLGSYKGNIKHKYIGALSRYKFAGEVQEKENILVILSGPEPQRSILEEIIVNQVKDFSEKVILVRGIIEDKVKTEEKDNLTMYNYLNGNKLLDEISCAKIVISRSGYSSIMDLYTLKKKAFFIPTPGQSEQEYLAEYLKSKKIADYSSQSSFKLSDAIISYDEYSGF